LKLGQTVKPYIERLAQQHSIAGIYADPWQARLLCDELRGLGLPVTEIPQTHASRGPKDTRLYEAICNRELLLYDHADLRNATAGASAKELGNGLIFIQKAGRLKIDLLIALANCVDEALGPQVWALL
jgi:phage terminase large subunit-like protein